ncbi:transmembrane protein 120B isoform 1-T1 [Spinachia spinachia]
MSKPKFQTEWEEIDEEYQQLQETHKIYRQKLEELTNLQTTCSSAISKQRKCLKDLRYSLTKCSKTCDEKELELITEIKSQIKEKASVFFDMEAYLPKRNGLYLNLVLGNVNVTLLSNQAKFAYKDEYEKFKLYMTIILMLGAITCLFFLNYRVTDEIFNFLLVWYYCTLTIRESILMSNGSRIKGWWVSHHYVSTFLSGVMLTWPEGPMYQMFRSQFLAFSIYQSFVQFLQYYYQSGCLYRLRTLGERNQLDLTVGKLRAIFGRSRFDPLNSWSHLQHHVWKIGVKTKRWKTQRAARQMFKCFGQCFLNQPRLACAYPSFAEGFQSWMWRGLTFLLPFLFFGHFWQLYNSVTLFRLGGREDCKEWQVFMLALTFLVLFLGNSLTTLKVVHQKFQKNHEELQKND